MSTKVHVPILWDIDSPYWKHYLETGEMIIPTKVMTLAEIRKLYPEVDTSHIPEDEDSK